MKKKTWPTLYDKTKTGKIKVWKISVETLFGEVSITTQHGYENSKMTKTGKVIHKGKNIGKSNETTPYQQAVSQAVSKWQKKVDEGMVEDKAKIGKKVNYFPMLAKTYYSPTCPDVLSGKKKETKIDLPIIAQPKVNGVRCIAVKKRGQVKLWSRKMKEYTQVNKQLANHLNMHMVNGDVWDGDIYVHGWPFQRITRAVKKDRSTCWRKELRKAVKKREWEDAYQIVAWRHDTQLLEFHRYDIPSSNIPMSDRAIMLNLSVETDRICNVITTTIRHFDSIKKYHDVWVNHGYEGMVLRDPNAKYMWNARDKRLLKYKEFYHDAEFRIVGYSQGSANDEGTVIWKCRWTDSRGRNFYFNCRPRGTVSDRRKLYNKGYAYVGKMLTVRFQERSMDGVPIFPVGITIRDYE